MLQILDNPLHWAWAEEADFSAFRAVLADLGYTPQNVAADLGLSKVDDLYPLDYRLLPALVERLEKIDGPCAAACRLLLLGLPVEADQLTRSIFPGALKFLINSGLVFEQGGMLHALLSIVPFEDLVIVADKLFMNADPEARIEGLSSDNAVWRIDKTTLIMAKALFRKPWERALDLGCGSGVLALLAAKKSEQVTGADINPRAVNVAQFNARLNGISNCNFMACDLYRELAGQKYDYIFSNPPSAPGLVKAWNREGGGSGREIVEASLNGAAEYLNYDGIFQSTVHLGYVKDEDIAQWAGSFLPRNLFRTLIVKHAETWDAETYALNEAFQKAGSRDFPAYQRAYQMYKTGLQANRIEQITFAMLTSKRTKGAGGIEVLQADLHGGDWPTLLDPFL
ncbi:MAG: methyltransferase [Candidatus Edwardsbacteria bacterium]|nr:methyltransferase [Candidatus Edwardsbacteria bacterium]